MVVGMPNVGKSSLINALRRNYLKKGNTFRRLRCGGSLKVHISNVILTVGKATPVGKLPGVTRSVLTRILVSQSLTQLCNCIMHC